MTVEDVRSRNINAVLRESMRLFSKLGVERTSMSQIADAAGVTRRSVINYFDSKNALISAVQQEYLRLGTEELEEHFSSEQFLAMSGLEQYLAILRYSLNAVHHQYQMANNLTEMSTILRRDAELDLRGDLSQSLSIISSRLSPAYGKGLADGSISPACILSSGDASLVALMLRGLYRQLAYMLSRGAAEDAAFVDGTIEDFISLFRRILQAPCGREEQYDW